MDSPAQDAPSLIQSIPKVTRILALAFAMGTAATQIPGLGTAVVDNFALRPMSTIGGSKVWNVITAGFVELSVAKSIINIVLFLTLGKWIETSWGGRQFVVYLLLSNAFAGICTYIGLLAGFFATNIDKFLFAPVGTTNGVCAALFVAVKQLIPEHEIGANGVKISANYLPLLYITTNAVLTVIGLASVGELLFTLSAFQFSWLYLRYLKRGEGGRGDLSDSFSYASLFPEPLRTIVAVFANYTFILFKPVLMAGLTSEQDTNILAQDQAPKSQAASVDAERRRQRALKALDERMSIADVEGNEESTV